ncbi:hypothetical protein C0J52_12568 [Blattella germanica]|nr:hypothetical protein C0J52_12568 [Blattella germanica]
MVKLTPTMLESGVPKIRTCVQNTYVIPQRSMCFVPFRSKWFMDLTSSRRTL